MAKPSMFVKLSTQPGKRAELLAALDTMLEAVAAEPGTQVYSIHTDDTDENAVWIFEMYESAEAMAAHSTSDAMKALMGALGPLLGDAPILAATTPYGGKGVDL
ncbi:MAG TPA: putative quinol monooxygenase [Acidimicrobiales bacterium]|nr:putative quinol monooxygenase [Acidimicrobiales bacterium]